MTEAFCSESETDNIQPTVEKGSWVNTMAQVVDFSFDLTEPLTADNALYVEGLYFDYADYDPTQDYDTYMAQFAEVIKFEVHFQCVEDPTTTSESTTPESTTLESTTPESTTPESTTPPKTTLNFNYVNRLDQEYLINII